jgi:hypothetical protein
MVDHHLDDQNWGAPLDSEVPHTSGVGVASYIIAALILAAVAALWFWDGSTISLRTFSGPHDAPIPMDNPIQPLQSTQELPDR